MKRGLWTATGIVIGLTIAGVAGIFIMPSSAFTAHATPQGADSNNGPMIMGTGGANDNRQDVSWILFKDGKTEVKKGTEIDRYVLCAYKVAQGGRSFDIIDVRDVSFDVKAIHLDVAGHEEKFSPSNMRKAYAKSLP